jgi:monovalent cation/hydrogen antiporter
MPAIQVILGLLVAVAVLALAARQLHVPYPIVLVLGGLAIALVPGLPRVTLAPDIVFLVFLPPLVFSAGWFTSLRDFRANLRPIGMLSIGLVLATTVAVAVLAHALIPELPWPVAFALGAIVSPTDTVAPEAIFQRLGVPRRILVILEGESLVNDATGLIAYRFAVVAAVTGVFVAWQAGLQFVVSSIGGIALGLAMTWLLVQVQKRIEDPPIEITLSFLLPYAIYLAAQGLSLSGVLAVAAGGIYASRHSHETFSAASRVQAYAAWGVALFVLNGLVFVLIGLQLPLVRDGLATRPVTQLIEYGLVISLAVIVLRFLWVFPGAYLPHLLSARVRATEAPVEWRNVVVVGWTGMRGVVSLAAALSLPLATAAGAPFPGRDTVVLITFCVIMVTLVGQGLTLPLLLRALGVTGEDGSAEEAQARTQAIEAALAHLEEVAAEDGVPEEGLRYLRAYYGKRRKRIETQVGQLSHEHGPEDGLQHEHDGSRDHLEDHRDKLAAMTRLHLDLLGVERAAIVRLRDTDVIGDDVLVRVQRDLDLEELRLAAP